MKATAISPANIAFIKYWGRRDHNLFLPLSTTNSMNLSECKAITTVEFGDYSKDEVIIVTKEGKEKVLDRSEGEKTGMLFQTLDRVREFAGFEYKARVVSRLTFPFKAGIASSAAGLSAFVAASFKAAGLKEKFEDKKELSREVRLAGSPSAARSVEDGFTELLFGETHEESFTQKIADENHWDILDIIPVIASGEKKVSTSQGHEIAQTSPFFDARVEYLKGKSEIVKNAILERDFDTLAKYSQADTLNMHAIMMTSEPSAVYFAPESIEFIRLVQEWREEGIEVFFTFDAGPNPHLIVSSKYKDHILKEIEKLNFVEYVLVNKSSEGVRFDDSMSTF